MAHIPARTARLSIFLRVYGTLSLLIFVPLFVGFLVRTPLLSEDGGALNWLIWNDVHAGHGDAAHVPPMLFSIYIVWSGFLFAAARRPESYASFLTFTIWGNAVHGALMAVQALTDLDRYWSKFLTDIPFVLILAIGIAVWHPTRRPSRADAETAPAASSTTRG